MTRPSCGSSVLTLKPIPHHRERLQQSVAQDYRAVLVWHRERYPEPVDNPALAAYLAPSFGIAIDVEDHTAVEAMRAPEIVLELTAYRGRERVRIRQAPPLPRSFGS